MMCHACGTAWQNACTRAWVVRVAVQGREDDAARAEHDGRRPALGHHTDAERARG
jgi:hypothetical protein